LISEKQHPFFTAPDFAFFAFGEQPIFISSSIIVGAEVFIPPK
jgi:hypothetical protein